MKKIISKILLTLIISINFIEIDKATAIVPYYYMPSGQVLEKNSSLFADRAYYLLSIGRLNEGLQLAKLALSFDQSNEKLWAILAEAQIRNNLFKDALESIKKGKTLNSENSDFYFVESSIYLQSKKLKKARKTLESGLKIDPKNTFALFQLGNIFLMEKNYNEALKTFERAVKIKSNFWEVINNIGLAYYELDEEYFAEINFNRAISINRNGETLLALAVTLQNKDPEQSILLSKEALKLNPSFVSLEYREEQLWGDKIQKATQQLFKSQELEDDIDLAREYLK